MDIDRALGQVRRKLLMYILVSTAMTIPLTWHGLSIVFVGWEPPHVCVGLESPNITHFALHQSRANLSERNETPLDPKCHFENYDHETGIVSVMKCSNWTFENDGYHTIVEEWGLVCNRNYMAEMSQSLYQVGAIIGGFFSFMMDRYGRKKLHVISHLCLSIIGMINAYSVNSVMFTLSKSVIGFFVSINITSGCTLALELFNSMNSTLVGIGFQFFWTLCYIILPGLAYLIKDWNILQMTISLTSLLLVVLLIPIPESPSWSPSRKKPPCDEQIKDPVILKWLVISSLLWFSNSLIFYGLILASPSLQGNRFLNFVLLGLVEFPAMFLAYYCTKTFGRRLTCSASSFLTGCCMAAIIFIPKDNVALTWIAILSKGFISASFAIMVFYTKEIFPTDIRCTCSGYCQVCGRIGSLLAPVTAYMAMNENLFWVPNILFGVVSILVSFLLLFLPETNNQPLPESIEDCHRLNENKFFKCQKRR